VEPKLSLQTKLILWTKRYGGRLRLQKIVAIFGTAALLFLVLGTYLMPPDMFISYPIVTPMAPQYDPHKAAHHESHALRGGITRAADLYEAGMMAEEERRKAEAAVVQDSSTVQKPLSKKASPKQHEQHGTGGHHHHHHSEKEQEKQQQEPQHHHAKDEGGHHHHHHHHDDKHHEHHAHNKEEHDTSTSNIRFVKPSPWKKAVPREFDAIDEGMYNADADADAVEHTLKPRLLALDASVAMNIPPMRIVDVYPADFTDNTQLYPVLDSRDEALEKMEIREPLEQGECVPMQEWQTTYHPSCNGMHELAMEDMGRWQEEGNDIHLFGTGGFWRNAWRLDLASGGGKEKDEQDTIVLKTLKYWHNFEDAHFEHDRIDAIAMERLTASPHVINIFGFCGHSVLTEYANGSRVGTLADKKKKIPLARLEIARDIANGLADVHGIDGDGNTTFVHLDINPANVMSIGGSLKLNDFNIGILLKWNTTSNTQCGFPAQYPNPQWRSPEEARNETHLTYKVDIFSMGHIFFRLICGHEPWNKLELGGRPTKEEVSEKVKNGILPHIPDDIMKSKSEEIIAIRDAMLWCYKPDPKDRPSAREVANVLQKALTKLQSRMSVA